MSTPGDSPLSEALPTSLDELFSRDPLSLSDADIATIVEAERAFRAKYLADGGTGRAKKATKNIAAPKDLKFEDLEI
jgi:hypothetical protein